HKGRAAPRVWDPDATHTRGAAHGVEDGGGRRSGGWRECTLEAITRIANPARITAPTAIQTSGTPSRFAAQARPPIRTMNPRMYSAIAMALPSPRRRRLHPGGARAVPVPPLEPTSGPGGPAGAARAGQAHQRRLTARPLRDAAASGASNAS